MALTQIKAAALTADLIDETKLADNSIDSEHYNDGSIDTAHIADSQVTTAKIGADAITGAKIADDAIDSEHYTDGSIDTAHIADNAVDKDKLAHGLHLFCTGSDKGIILQGNIGEIGDVSGFQAVNDAANANTDFGIRANTIRFATTSAERARVTDNGITFNGDTAAANALDDYEEGTFTPDWNGATSGTTTYSTNQGSYTKIGNLVHVRIYSGINGTSGSGAWRVTNLPFASPSGVTYITTGSCMLDGLDFNSNYTWVVPYKNSNSTILDLYASGDNLNWSQVQVSDDSSFAIILGITYAAA